MTRGRRQASLPNSGDLGRDQMAALIEFVCIWKHEDRGDSTVTVEQGVWAYCAAGAVDGHHWTRIDPTAVETVR